MRKIALTETQTMILIGFVSQKIEQLKGIIAKAEASGSDSATAHTELREMMNLYYALIGVTK